MYTLPHTIVCIFCTETDIIYIIYFYNILLLLYIIVYFFIYIYEHCSAKASLF